MDNSWKEISAKTVDEAVTEALAELMTTSDKLEYEVIEEGKSGFLGIGAKPAKIKARIKEIVSKDSDSYNEEGSASDEEVLNSAEDSVSIASADENPAPDSFEADIEGDERRGGRTLSSDEITSLAESFLRDVFSAMEIETSVSSNYVEGENELSVKVDSADKGILIGKRGQTLDSLQYLTSLVVNKDSDRYIKVKLDSEDYRARRKETLENLAKNIALKVKRTAHSVSLEPMNSFERRIIHSALQSDDEIETHSEGAEPYRKVVVSLTKEAYAKRKNARSNDRSRKPYGRKSSYGGRSGGYSHGGYTKSSYSNRRSGNPHRRNDQHKSYDHSPVENDNSDVNNE